MTQLELQDVTKRFDGPEGEIIAVDDLSLSVDDGEFLVLLGPSGCGKTTTLRMIGGLEEPSEGDVLFDDIRVNDVKPRNRDVAMVFQDFALYPHMTIEQNLGFGLRRSQSDLSDEGIKEKIQEVAEMLGIEDMLKKTPSSLSGGQKQRVALGRAIVREPRLFLFDEPLANLDAQLRKVMRTEIVELQSKIGITAAYVTHNQEEAMTIADKIAILNNGALQQLGAPAEIFNEPRNLFVAQFVGSPNMNVFDAEMTEDGDSYRVELPNCSFTVDATLVDSTDTTNVKVGFRPQDLFRVASDARRGGHEGPRIETDVNVIEPLGTDAIVHAGADTADISATVADFNRIAVGDTVEFTIDPRHIYIFEGDTERLIKPRLNSEIDDSEVSGGIEA